MDWGSRIDEQLIDDREVESEEDVIYSDEGKHSNFKNQIQLFNLGRSRERMREVYLQAS